HRVARLRAIADDAAKRMQALADKWDSESSEIAKELAAIAKDQDGALKEGTALVARYEKLAAEVASVLLSLGGVDRRIKALRDRETKVRERPHCLEKKSRRLNLPWTFNDWRRRG